MLQLSGVHVVRLQHSLQQVSREVADVFAVVETRRTVKRVAVFPAKFCCYRAHVTTALLLNTAGPCNAYSGATI